MSGIIEAGGDLIHNKCELKLYPIYNQLNQIIGFLCPECHREWRII